MKPRSPLNCYWIQNTETTLADLRRASAGVAVLPLASIESHGPHLPLGSDSLVAEHVLAQVVRQETVAILPVVHYSYVASARALPGAIHIDSPLLVPWVETVCDEVYRNGFDKVVLLHMHGGNPTLHWHFARRIEEADKPYAVYSLPVLLGDVWDRIKPLLQCPEQGHACEMETSMNMVACPQLVRLDLLGKRTFKRQPAPQVGLGVTPADWIATWPDMAVGEPQHATPEKGEQIVAAWTSSIVKHLRLVKADTIAPRVMASYIQRTRAHRGRHSKPGGKQGSKQAGK